MSRARVTVARSVWHVVCPACHAEVNIEQTDAGQYDGIDVVVDCLGCGAEIHTETVVLVVASLSPFDTSARAKRIRGKATTQAVVRAMLDNDARSP